MCFFVCSQVSSAFETLRTLRAHVRPLLCVNHHVLLATLSLRKAFPANGASERAFTCVRTLMDRTLAGSDEPSIAHITLVGLLSSVNAYVHLEVPRRREALATCGAGEGLFSCVGADVNFEVSQQAKQFATIGTAVLGGVYSLVRLELGGRREALAAHLAEGRLLPFVFGQMVLKATFGNEVFVALIAMVGPELCVGHKVVLQLQQGGEMQSAELTLILTQLNGILLLRLLWRFWRARPSG